MADRAPSVRSAPNEPFEHRGEMGLRLESNCQSDLGDGHGCVLQQFFSPPNSSLQEKLVGSQACRHPELGGEVHSAQSGNHSQIREGDFRREMAVDIFDDPLKAPFLQSANLPAHRLYSNRFDSSSNF